MCVCVCVAAINKTVEENAFSMQRYAGSVCFKQ